MLPKHQVDILNEIHKTIVSGCKQCNGESYDCQCRGEFQILKKMVVSNIPLKYLFIELNDIVDEGISKIKRVVEHFVEDFKLNVKRGRCFLFYSREQGRGSGKTSLSCIMLKHAIRSGYSGYFLTMSECISMYRQTFNNSYAEAVLRDKLENVDVLVVDDIKKGPEWVHTFLYSVIQERCNKLKITILTSNFDAKEDGTGEAVIGNSLFLLISKHMEFLEFSNGSFDPTDYKQKSQSSGIKVKRNAKSRK